MKIDELGDSMVECDYCNARMAHHVCFWHQQNECPKSQVICPLKCTKDSLLRQKIDEHLKKDCKFMSITCARCDLEVMRADTPQHNCVKSLKGMLKALQATVME